jgi:cytosine/uracil/thiamine/allantoin permease
MLLCNFRSSGTGANAGADPFPNAPRLINSDAAYFILLSANAFVRAFITYIISANIRYSVDTVREQKHMGVLLSLFSEFGLFFGSLLALPLYYSLCGCNPIDPKK